MIRTLTTTLGLLLFSSSLFAMSHVPAELRTQILLTNSTPDTLTVHLAGDADAKLNVTEIAPLSTVDLAQYTRHPDTDSQLTIQLSADNYQVNLTQQNLNNSFSFGANTHDLEVKPQQETQIQRFQTTLNGDLNTLAFNAYNLNKGGKITYVLQQQDPKPALGGANQLNLLSYNIWATTIFGSKKVDTRLAEMPEVMAGYDAIVLTEVFDLLPGKKLLENLAAEYPYQSEDIFKLGKIMTSGTRIVSRWPIEDEQHLKFNDCNGIQCAATRGVIYLKINKQGKPYHLFATHTQSSDDDANRNARLTQLEEMGEFVRSLEIPADEPVIMAGDFNVNKIGLPEDRDYLETVLSATEPENRGHTLTYDSNTNYWAEKPYLEYLDYTLTGNDHLQPISAYQEAFAPRTITEALWEKWDLSDHYAVRGIFVYPN